MYFIVFLESSKKHPILKVLLTNTTAILGGVASLHCLVTSDSVTYIRWYFKMVLPVQVNASINSTQGEFTEITSSLPVKVSSFEASTSNTHLFKGEAVYLIQNASFKDEGEYICEAFNQHSKGRHGAFLIVVKGDLCLKLFFQPVNVKLSLLRIHNVPEPFWICSKICTNGPPV